MPDHHAPCPLCGGPMSISFELHAFEAGTAGRMQPHWHATRKRRCDACFYRETTRWRSLQPWPEGDPDGVREIYGALDEMATGLSDMVPPDTNRRGRQGDLRGRKDDSNQDPVEGKP